MRAKLINLVSLKVIGLILLLTVPRIGFSEIIQIQVKEIAGVDREGDIVTSGIPFPKNALRGEEHVRLLRKEGNNYYEEPLQTRVLGYWDKNRESIKWLLVDFQADVSANSQAEYYLEYGDYVQRGSFANMDVTQTANEIIINTGKAEFKINKQNFNLLDYVKVEDKVLVDGGGDVIIKANGKEYRTSLSDANLEIEETGHLRTVLKVTGKHKATDGEEFFDYIFRINFYKDKSFVKVFYTFINTKVSGLIRLSSGGVSANLERISVEDISITIPLSIQATRIYSIVDDTVHSGNLTGIANIYQGSAEAGNNNAYTIKHGSVVLENGNRFDGFADLSDSEKGLTVTTKYFWQNYPKALSVSNDGKVEIGLIPENYEILSSMAKTHEILLYFHTNDAESAKSKEITKAFKKPLRAEPSAQWIADSRAFGDISPAPSSVLPEFDDALENAIEAFLNSRDKVKIFGTDEKGAYGIIDFGDHSQHGRDWDGGGFANLHDDSAHSFALAYARTLDRRFFNVLEESIRHFMDVDQIHYSDLEFGPGSYDFNHLPFHHSGGENRMHRGKQTQGHSWNGGILDYYYLTGDEWAKEIAVNIADKIARNTFEWYGDDLGYPVDSYIENRSLGWGLTILTDTYLLNWKQEYIDAAKVYVDIYYEKQGKLRLEDGSIYNTGKGIWVAEEKKRDGVVWKGISPWQVGGVVLPALYRYYEITQDNRVPGMITWAADWLMLEGFTEDLKIRSRVWYSTRTGQVDLDYNPTGLGPYAGHITGMGASGISYAYAVSGNTDYINYARDVLVSRVIPSLLTQSKTGHKTWGQGLRETPHALFYIEHAQAGGGGLTVTTSSIENGIVGQAYSQQLQASGGEPPYIWSIASGNVPAGLSLNENGIINGTPLQEETQTFTVRVEDNRGDGATRSLSINVIIPDSIPPANITDLIANPGTEHGTIILSWTAPGDDGNQGTATEYEIRYSTSVITGSNWGLATQVPDEPTPEQAGSYQSYTATQLTAGQIYYFGIKTKDEGGNTSEISNIVSAIAFEDLTPPVISNISAQTSSTTSAITWQTDEPADSRVEYGIGSSYGLTVENSALTTSHSLTITDLQPETEYHYRVTSKDTAGNITESGEMIFITTKVSEGLVAYYKFEGNANDETGNNHGEIHGAQFVDGKVGQGISFDGSSYIEVPDSDSLDLIGEGTLIVWINPYEATGTTDIIVKGINTAERNRPYKLELSNNKIRGGIADGSGVQHCYSDTGVIVVNTWQHIALTWDGTTIQLYHNGEEVGNRPQRKVPFNSDKALRIGAFSPSAFQFKGIIDEMKIYNRALSMEEVIEDMNSGQNHAPLLIPIGNKTINEGEFLEFTISATDQDNDTLTYSSENLPQGATFANRKFTWTPDYTQAGSYPITFTVSDTELDDSEIITITVNNLDIAPRNLITEAKAGGRIKLNWEHSPEGNKAKYNIYYDNGTGTIDYTNPLGTVNYPYKSWTSASLTDGVTYKFGVRAVDTSGLEEKNTSITASITADSTPPGKPGTPILIYSE